MLVKKKKKYLSVHLLYFCLITFQRLWTTFQGIMYLFTHPHIVPIQYDLLFSVNHQRMKTEKQDVLSHSITINAGESFQTSKRTLNLDKCMIEVVHSILQ